MVVGFTATYAISVYHHICCEFASHSGEVYLIHHFVIKFVSDLLHVSGFLRVLWFPPPIKLTAKIHFITEILLKMALNIITLTLIPHKKHKLLSLVLMNLRQATVVCPKSVCGTLIIHH